MPREARRDGRRGPALIVFAASGLLGFIIGISRFQTWHVAVETAQVLAGLVSYPADNPFYVYHTKLWTVLCQILALLLRAGVSEIALSQLLSGLLGMVSFQAVAMLAYAFSRDAIVAVGTPLLVLYARAAEHGTTYPIALMGTDHTYGAMGLSLIVLVVALLGTGWYRAGGFLLGFAPAVHPALGLWAWLIVGGSLAVSLRSLREDARPWLPSFAAGCGITALSLAAHFMMAPDLAAVDPAVSASHLQTFVTTWDDHRRPASIVSVGTFLNVSALTMGVVWLLRFSNDLTAPAAFALRTIVVSAALSLAAMFVSWLPPGVVPPVLLTLMPSRFLNVNILAFVPLVAGLLAIHRRSVTLQAALALFVSGVFLSYRSMLWESGPAAVSLSERIHINPWHVFVGAAVAAVAVRATLTPREWRLPAAILRSATLAVMAACLVLTWRLPQAFPLLDRTNDPFFAAVAEEREGLLATAGSFHLVQLYTRRPVLVDGGALDTLTYAPEGGPEMVRILRDVYGLDFFNPPPEARRSSVIQHRLNKPVWEQFSRIQWQEIRWKFRVTQLLTRADWTLDLPLVAENRYFKLYRIPE